MYLILQSRTDQSGWHELKVIYEATGLSYHDLAVVNLASEHVTQKQVADHIKRAKAVIIGGLGESGYGEKDPVKKESNKRLRNKVVPVLREHTETDKANVLGICFGHQMLGEALGAPVEHAPEQAEVGTKTVRLTPEGKKDPLFRGMNESFSVIQGHNDAVLSLPTGAVHLAQSDVCPIQAFRYKKNVYGVQFHPELDEKELEHRLSIYGEAYSSKYVPSDKAGVPEANTMALFKNFLHITSQNSQRVTLTSHTTTKTH